MRAAIRPSVSMLRGVVLDLVRTTFQLHLKREGGASVHLSAPSGPIMRYLALYKATGTLINSVLGACRQYLKPVKD